MKRNIESRIDDIEEQSDSALSIGEFWLRDIDDSLEDPQEPWEAVYQGETE